MAEPPRAKKAKRSSHFDRKWATEFAGIAASSKGKYINSGHFSLASYVMLADGINRPCVGRYWWDVSKLITLDGQPRFPWLCKLMKGLMSIPASNADAERGFSMLRKIHTDQRSNLSQSTIIALMSIKLNCEDCCIDAELPDDLLKDCKKATTLAVKK